MQKNKKILIITILFINLLISSKINAVNINNKNNLIDNIKIAAADNVPPKNLPTTNNNQEGGGGVLKSPLGNGDNDTDLRTVLSDILDVVQTIIIMISTLYILYAGLNFILAKGDPEKIKKSQNALLWGLIGIALILTAEVLALGIGDTVKEVFKGN